MPDENNFNTYDSDDTYSAPQDDDDDGTPNDEVYDGECDCEDCWDEGK